FAGAIALATRAARRTGLGLWHPALAWLALEAVFFGLGSIGLAIADGRPGAAWDVAASVIAFGLSVAASDAIARRRSADAPIQPPRESLDPTASDGAAIRWAVVVAMIALGVVAVVPTLLSVGL